MHTLSMGLTFGGSGRRYWMRACHRRRPEPRRASTAAARASRPDVRPDVAGAGIHFSTLRCGAQGQCRGLHPADCWDAVREGGGGGGGGRRRRRRQLAPLPGL